jgi:hypothetical protein
MEEMLFTVLPIPGSDNRRCRMMPCFALPCKRAELCLEACQGLERIVGHDLLAPQTRRSPKKGLALELGRASLHFLPIISRFPGSFVGQLSR